MFGPLIVKPSKSKGDKTGCWRVRLKPKLLQKNCAGCKMCLLTCPEGCIQEKEKNTYAVDYNYCKGCGLCAWICPKGDIIMIEETNESEQK